MHYFKPDTLDDLYEMKRRGDEEGATLEYKSSRIFNQKNEKVFESLSKELTAFANTIGGALIIGVEDEQRRIAEIAPITDSTKHESWLEDGLLTCISPSLQITIKRIDADGGHILVIDVPPSRNAPHQAADKRYYARRLFRIDPLLAFEVDDIRRRIASSTNGANLSVIFDSGSISFSINNEGIESIFDASIQVDGIENTSIAQQWSPGLTRPYTEPFRVIHSGETRHFPGAGFEFFQRNLEDRMEVSLHYTDEFGKSHQRSYTYFLKDFHNTHSLKVRSEELLSQGVKQLERIDQSIADLVNNIKLIRESAFHPTGLNLSRTTLAALSNQAEIKWPGESLSYEAIAEVLEIDIDTAIKIQRELFGASCFIGGTNKALEDIDLPDDVKERICQRLILPK